MKVYVIYENEDWMPPLRTALDDAGVPSDGWFVDEGHFDITSEPPEVVFLNRMRASSHTREAFRAAVREGDIPTPPAHIRLLRPSRRRALCPGRPLRRVSGA